MSRLKAKALSKPPSQTPLEGGLDSAPPLTSNTVASTRLAVARRLKMTGEAASTLGTLRCLLNELTDSQDDGA